MGVCVTPAGGFAFRSVCLRFLSLCESKRSPWPALPETEKVIKADKNYFLSTSSPELLHWWRVGRDGRRRGEMRNTLFGMCEVTPGLS